MKYMLDTNICIYIIKNKYIRILDKLKNIKPDEICISVITYCELIYGVEKSTNKEKNRLALTMFLSQITILPIDSNTIADTYGILRTNLEAKGTPIGSLDMLIAAHCILHNLILVTNNVKEFNRIPNLQIENWIE